MAKDAGLFLFDKPRGMTSHDAVACARRWFDTRAIGHTGTLDPMATGLLVLCVNAATRVSEYVLGQDKAYAATIKLGVTTNTDDAEGEVLLTRSVPEISDAQLRAIAAQFTGVIEQIPPQFSAIKKDGQRAYALARAGETVELASRRVQIDSLTLARVLGDSEHLSASISCGSGTYIRSLARDIGEVLGCGAHLTQLHRLRIGIFSVENAISMEIAKNTPQQQLISSLVPMDQALTAYPAISLDAAQTARLRMGQRFHVTDTTDAPVIRVYDADGMFIAVAEIVSGLLKPTKVLA